MTKLAPEWVRTSDPVIRSPARYRWTTAPARECPWKTGFYCNIKKNISKSYTNNQFKLLFTNIIVQCDIYIYIFHLLFCIYCIYHLCLLCICGLSYSEIND